jgi:hypothetical protein
LSVFGAALAASPPAAWAQSDEPASAATGSADALADRVILNNGVVLPGTIVRVDPGFQIELVLVNGQHQVVPWPAIRMATHLGQPIPAFAPPPPPPPPPPGPPKFRWGSYVDVPQAGPPDMTPSPGSPRIHIDANRPDVTLYAYIGDRTSREVVLEGIPMCKAPCDLVIQNANDREFYFTSPDVTRSSHFVFSGTDLTARVDTGSRSVRVAGTLITVLAGAASVIASGVAIGAATKSGPHARAAAEDGAIAAGVSGGVLLVGLVLIGVSTTSYTIGPRDPRPTSLRAAAAF